MKYDAEKHINIIIDSLLRCNNNGTLGNYYNGMHQSLGEWETFRYGTGFYLGIVDQGLLTQLLTKQNLLHLLLLDESEIQLLAKKLYRCPMEVGLARNLMEKHIKVFGNYPNDLNNWSCDLLNNNMKTYMNNYKKSIKVFLIALKFDPNSSVFSLPEPGKDHIKNYLKNSLIS